MPNHEANYVTIIGTPDQLAAVDAALIDGDERVDFNGVVPMPEELRGTTSPTQPGDDPEVLAELFRKYGATDWYRWSVDNWGTKWNAYGKHEVDRVEPGRLNLSFLTAWSQPTPLFKAIEEKFGVTVHAITIDEGGFDDVLYGTPFEYMYAEKIIHFE